MPSCLSILWSAFFRHALLKVASWLDTQVATLLAEGVATSEELLRLTALNRALTQHDADLEVRTSRLPSLVSLVAEGIKPSVLSHLSALSDAEVEQTGC